MWPELTGGGAAVRNLLSAEERRAYQAPGTTLQERERQALRALGRQKRWRPTGTFMGRHGAQLGMSSSTWEVLFFAPPRPGPSSRGRSGSRSRSTAGKRTPAESEAGARNETRPRGGGRERHPLPAEGQDTLFAKYLQVERSEGDKVWGSTRTFSGAMARLAHVLRLALTLLLAVMMLPVLRF